MHRIHINVLLFPSWLLAFVLVVGWETYIGINERGQIWYPSLPFGALLAKSIDRLETFIRVRPSRCHKLCIQDIKYFGYCFVGDFG